MEKRSDIWNALSKVRSLLSVVDMMVERTIKEEQNNGAAAALQAIINIIEEGVDDAMRMSFQDGEAKEAERQDACPSAFAIAP